MSPSQPLRTIVGVLPIRPLLCHRHTVPNSLAALRPTIVSLQNSYESVLSQMHVWTPRKVSARPRILVKLLEARATLFGRSCRTLRPQGQAQVRNHGCWRRRCHWCRCWSLCWCWVFACSICTRRHHLFWLSNASSLDQNYCTRSLLGNS